MPKSTDLTAPSGNLTEALDRYIETSLVSDQELSLEGMLTQVLGADSPEAWEAMFQELDNLQDNDGREFRVHSVRGARSTVEGAAGWYLIADVTWLDSGQRGMVGVSAIIPVAQLIKCHQEGWLPRDFRIVRKSEATAAGWHPIHLQTLPKDVSVQQELSA